MIEFLEGAVDVIIHGDVHVYFFVIPFEIESTL